MIIKEKKHNDGELKFSEIDEPLKQHYIRLFITLLFSFFVELIVSIVAKSFDVFLFCSVFILIYTIILLIQVYRILSGNVYSYTGECADIHFKSKKNILDTDRVVIKQTDGTLIKIVPHSRKEMNFSMGDTIRVYCVTAPKYLPRINDNTFSVPSYYFMVCIRSRTPSKKDKKEN